MTSENVYNMKFGKIYPLLVNKAMKKGRTQGEVDQIITWLTGYTRQSLNQSWIRSFLTAIFSEMLRPPIRPEMGSRALYAVYGWRRSKSR